MYQLSRATIGGQRLRLDFIGHVRASKQDPLQFEPFLMRNP